MLPCNGRAPSSWGRETEYGTRYSILLSKLYKPKNGDLWKYSDSLDEEDALSIPRVLNRAVDFIREQKSLKQSQEVAELRGAALAAPNNFHQSVLQLITRRRTNTQLTVTKA